MPEWFCPNGPNSSASSLNACEKRKERMRKNDKMKKKYHELAMWVRSSWIFGNIDLPRRILFFSKLFVKDCKKDMTKVLIFCYRNCSDLLWEKNVLVIEKKLLKFEAEGRKFSKFLRLLNRTIFLFKQWKVRTIFGNKMHF